MYPGRTGFRKYPWANTQSATLLFSTGYKKFKGNYAGQWRLTDSNVLGRIDLLVSGYLGNPRLSLAARAAGRKLWGPYPWFESATIGGSDDVRGYDSNRYRGDASLFGNAELRYWLGNRKKPTLPMRWGLFGSPSPGVWLKGETSEKWHMGSVVA